jgi:hypothetical protein
VIVAFLAVLLPGLYWDQSPETASAVKQAAIERLYVPADQLAVWKKEGFDAQPFDAARFVKLPPPGVRYQMDVAAATNVPWVDANGWRFERGRAQNNDRQYYYNAPWRKAPLAAAEAYAYGANAVVHPDSRDLTALGRMLAFLRSIDGPRLPAFANIGVIDDGSAETGEVLNLLARRNLLFRVVQTADPALDLNVRIGSTEYPKAEAANPAAFATTVRQKLTDEKRLVRVYGSDVVIARLEGDEHRIRIHLINYGGGRVEGLRVRVRGPYPHGALAAFGLSNVKLADYGATIDATEFTISEMDVYAIVDLEKQ